MRIDNHDCPICGAKAFVDRDIVDGFYFGWSAGCPRWSLYDPHHPHYEGEPHLTVLSCDSKDDALEKWDRIRNEITEKQELTCSSFFHGLNEFAEGEMK